MSRRVRPAGDPGPYPPDPPPNVQPKPGGSASLPRLLLVKPDRTGDEILDGLLCERKLSGAEAVAEEVEAPLDAADEGLVRVFFEERRESAYGYKQTSRRSKLRSA